MKQTTKLCPHLFRCFLLGAIYATFAVGAQGATYTFTNSEGDSAYSNPFNWSENMVPDIMNGDTAVIGDGSAVTYTPGKGITISNGGTLEISNGSFTQVVETTPYQLAGNGTIQINGGTFNQGTASSFNVVGSGNLVSVSAGTLNVNTSFDLPPGLTFQQSGGVVNVTGTETNFTSTAITLSGGIFNTPLITGANAPGNAQFNISGGQLNLTGSFANGISAGGPSQYINFTPGSVGEITFSSGSTTISDVQNFINAGAIQYNNGGTGTLSDFTITSNAGVVTLTGIAAPVPEPANGMVTLGCLVVAGMYAALRKPRQAGLH